MKRSSNIRPKCLWEAYPRRPADLFIEYYTGKSWQKTPRYTFLQKSTISISLPVSLALSFSHEVWAPLSDKRCFSSKTHHFLKDVGFFSHTEDISVGNTFQPDFHAEIFRQYFPNTKQTMTNVYQQNFKKIFSDDWKHLLSLVLRSFFGLFLCHSFFFPNVKQ